MLQGIVILYNKKYNTVVFTKIEEANLFMGAFVDLTGKPLFGMIHEENGFIHLALNTDIGVKV